MIIWRTHTVSEMSREHSDAWREVHCKKAARGQGQSSRQGLQSGGAPRTRESESYLRSSCEFLILAARRSSYSQDVRPVERGRYPESVPGHFEIAVATRGRVRIPLIVNAGERVIAPVAAFTPVQPDAVNHVLRGGRK